MFLVALRLRAGCKVAPVEPAGTCSEKYELEAYYCNASRINDESLFNTQAEQDVARDAALAAGAGVVEERGGQGGQAPAACRTRGSSDPAARCGRPAVAAVEGVVARQQYMAPLVAWFIDADDMRLGCAFM